MSAKVTVVTKPDPLTSDDLARMQHRADRFSRSIGTVYYEMARDIYRLLAERERLLRELVAKH